MLKGLLERSNCEVDTRDKKVCSEIICMTCTVGIHTDSQAKEHKPGISACILLHFLAVQVDPLYAAADAGHMKVVQYLTEE